MSILRHPATLARAGASRRKNQPPDTFLNVPLFVMCIGTWAVIIGVGELISSLF